MKYDHQQIEAKWQKFWLDNKTFKTENKSEKPKYYVLDMFPYPSGSGLHVGHVEGYTATDILARYMRAKGYNVLHPMGWDSFGLPAEQYAIRTGTHPAQSTKENIDNFRRQLRSLGFSYDWDREIATSDPSYYKWTQWIFTKLYEKGLAYEAEMLVNFCPALGTVLANEEVENGKAKEGGHPVERRPLRQWILKITAYADRLIQDLDLVDWPESLKKLQINWIGKSEGAHVYFMEPTTKEILTVFTTRPDTLFGATYMVLAPEHPLVPRITTPEQREAVEEYQRQVASKSDLDRTELNREKTGVFTGGYAINPVNGKSVPIWISDYVLMTVGTGAIMAVPAHDERDFEFAQVFQLPIVPVYDPKEEEEIVRQDVLNGKKCWPGTGIAINSEHGDLSLNGLTVEEAKRAVIEWLDLNKKGKAATTYKLRDWLFSRQRYWGEPFPLLKFEDGSIRLLGEDELPLCPPELSDYKPSGDGQSPLAKVKEWVEITDPKTGKKVFRETNIMPQWAGSCWYYLRFCDPHNDQQAWNADVEKYWLPVDMYVGGVEHAVLHLLYARFWHKVLYDCGYVHTLEPFQTLRNQGLIVARSYQNSSRAYIDPNDVQEREGKFFDVRTGEELTSQIEKMSKSKLNGVTPDEIIQEYGADALRLYEMFMGPLEKEKIWNTDAVSGCRRFLNRFYDMAFSEKVSNEVSEEALRMGHRLVHGVKKDIESLQFNTAIAKMMEFMNEFTKLPLYPRIVVRMATQALAPFAPHLAEEVWQQLGYEDSLAYALFPEIEEKYLQDEVITYVVQINGKLRGRFELPKDQTQETVLEAARQHPHIKQFIEGKEINKVIFVPNKLLNIVLAS
ncbi:leucine--tRNA ligase [Candidatus Protochlamydia phocaeensis]|uniref:leucine--tRNA ligase n=1 Tax=Candidatus Protochlamydia phocaeensis TaxID=1414722 RepID=UPI000838A00D|nr:leucine--tRNA ligase [Candidatus Protochlamydia phocaeensis]